MSARPQPGFDAPGTHLQHHNHTDSERHTVRERIYAALIVIITGTMFVVAAHYGYARG